MSWAMDELEARASTQLGQMREFNEQLTSISIRETSPDDRVTVEVDGQGALTGLWLAQGANELGGARLGELIVTTSAMAAQRAFARRATVVGDFTTSFTELLDSRPRE